jgi:DNA-binding transcriptional LysR family regulator
MARIDDIEVFIEIYELGSLTLAARKSGLPVTTVSRKLQELEQRIGATLLSRTTRSVTPTEAGTEFYDKVAPAYAAIREAEGDMTGHTREPAGTIRFMVPFTFGFGLVQPLIWHFSATYPAVAFSVIFDNTTRDPTELGVDMAIMLGDLPDSQLVCRRLGEIDLCLVASPDYLASHALIDHPNDLTAHRLHGVSIYLPPRPWGFTRAGETVELKPNLALVANETGVVTAAALRGDGIARTARLSVETQLQSGALVEVLPNWRGTRRPHVNLFYARRLTADRKMRLFIDFILMRSKTYLTPADSV